MRTHSLRSVKTFVRGEWWGAGLGGGGGGGGGCVYS